MRDEAEGEKKGEIKERKRMRKRTREKERVQTKCRVYHENCQSIDSRVTISEIRVVHKYVHAT